MHNTAVLLIDCPDRKGIVAAVSEFLFSRNVNILHADQHQDADRDRFLMRVEWDVTGLDLTHEQMSEQFAPVAGRFGMNWKMKLNYKPFRVALFVSKHDHCLVDLLYRHQAGELCCDIPLIVSNHTAAKKWADFYGVDFEHTPIEKGTKSAAEDRQLQLLRDYDINLMVMARYMQILSDRFIAQYPHDIINVHHSFLPAFMGAKPYHQAFQRGVKLIGATGHYATPVLDDGPIIEQEVIRVSHRDSLDDVIRKGRDVEKWVLSRAVKWHIEHRVLLYDDKTVVFD